MHADFPTICQFFGWGALGGLIGGATKSHRLQLPRVIRRGVDPGDRVILIDLGFLASILLGGTVAMIVDGRVQTALAYGLAAGFAGPAVVNALIDPLLRKIGMPPAVPDEKEPQP